MKRITIPNYVPTLTKGVHSDLEVTYSFEDITNISREVIIDEVFCNGANITELLTDIAKKDLAKEVKRILVREANDAEIAAKGVSNA